MYSIFLPVAGIPNRSPACVPLADQLIGEATYLCGTLHVIENRGYLLVELVGSAPVVEVFVTERIDPADPVRLSGTATLNWVPIRVNPLPAV